ncbi:unnamed protein product [Adineta steineri]|uniref:Uncharacterized protein n=2 Tax=Adineta steineri TaxID=433720 RepID=A0A813NGK7_9BILA|nr:unnamed protein product [Adineta steineri]
MILLFNHYYSSVNVTQLEVAPRRWSTTDRTVGDKPNNAGPYIRRRSDVEVNGSTSPALSNSVNNSKWRVNCDEETKAQRERRSTQSITDEDIKATEQQIKNRSDKLPSSLINTSC